MVIPRIRYFFCLIHHMSALPTKKIIERQHGPTRFAMQHCSFPQAERIFYSFIGILNNTLFENAVHTMIETVQADSCSIYYQTLLISAIYRFVSKCIISPYGGNQAFLRCFITYTIHTPRLLPAPISQTNAPYVLQPAHRLLHRLASLANRCLVGE
jgi:hypothetical protein